MSGIDVVVILAGTALIAGLAWFFFKPRQAAHAGSRAGCRPSTCA